MIPDIKNEESHPAFALRAVHEIIKAYSSSDNISSSEATDLDQYLSEEALNVIAKYTSGDMHIISKLESYPILASKNDKLKILNNALNDPLSNKKTGIEELKDLKYNIESKYGLRISDVSSQSSRRQA